MASARWGGGRSGETRVPTLTMAGFTATPLPAHDKQGPGGSHTHWVPSLWGGLSSDTRSHTAASEKPDRKGHTWHGSVYGKRPEQAPS